MFEFREEDHSYWLDGERVPSVTQILNEWRKVNIRGASWYVNSYTGTVVDAGTFEAAGDFGTAVHKAARIILLNMGLDWEALDPALIPVLREFQRWIEDYKVRPVQVEVPDYHRRKKYAGTPDIIGHTKSGRELQIWDIKTGDHATAGPQLSGYSEIHKSAGYRGVITRHVLYLPKDGSPYKHIPCKNTKDAGFFESKLYQHRYMKAA